MSDDMLAEMERQLREAEAQDKATAKADQDRFNPRLGTDPETGGLTVDIDLPDNASIGEMIEGMQAAARKAGLL